MHEGTRILLAVPFDWGNKGDVAVCNSMIGALSRVFGNADYMILALGRSVRPVPACKFKTIEYVEPSGTFRFLLTALKITVWAILYRLWGVSSFWVSGREHGLLTAYEKADLILLPARDIISTTYGVSSLISDALFGMMIAVFAGKKTMVYAAQIGPFASGVAGRCAAFLSRQVLDRVDLITVRGRISARWLRELGVRRPRVYVTADPAYLLPGISRMEATALLSKQSHSTCDKPLVGINVSSLIWRFGFAQAGVSDDGGARRERYIEGMVLASEFLVHELGARVVLLPHVFGASHDDVALCEEIRGRVECGESVGVIREEREPEELKGIIGLFDMFVAARHHPLIHSVSQGVPTIAIDYTFKMREVMEELGCEEWVIDMANFDAKDLIHRLRLLWSIRKEARQRLLQRVDLLKQRALANAMLARELTLRTEAGALALER